MTSIRVYAVAFVLLLASGAAAGISALGSLRSIGLLQVSAALSVSAIAAALASLRIGRTRA